MQDTLALKILKSVVVVMVVKSKVYCDGRTER